MDRSVHISNSISREDLISVIDGSDLPLVNSSNRQRLRFIDPNSLQKLCAACTSLLPKPGLLTLLFS